MKTGPISISKKCRICKTVKLLNQFEIDNKTKDKRATICKDCFVKEQPTICSCSCERCTDTKIVKAPFSAVELLLTRVEKGLDISEEMLMMISSLASSAGILRRYEKKIVSTCETMMAYRTY